MHSEARKSMLTSRSPFLAVFLRDVQSLFLPYLLKISDSWLLRDYWVSTSQAGCTSFLKRLQFQRPSQPWKLDASMRQGPFPPSLPPSFPPLPLFFLSTIILRPLLWHFHICIQHALNIFIPSLLCWLPFLFLISCLLWIHLWKAKAKQNVHILFYTCSCQWRTSFFFIAEYNFLCI